MMELRDVPGFPGYAVTADGCVWSNVSRSWLKQFTYRGYRRVTAAKRVLKVHRAVALAWVPNPLNKPHVNHIDGDKENNRDSNLEWCTPAENNAHAVRVGLATNLQGATAQNAAKSHCKRGHPFDENNTYHYLRNGNRVRGCRACGSLRKALLSEDGVEKRRTDHRMAQRRYAAKKRAARCEALIRDAARNLA